MDEKLTNTFDNYLTDRMIGSKRVRFENELAKDKELKKDFEKYKQAIKAIKISGISSEIKHIVQNQNAGSRGRKIRVWSYVGIAASIIGVLGVTYFNSFKESLFDEYFEPYPDLISTRSVENSVDIMIHYNEGDYDAAINLFEQEISLSHNYKFYLGVSYLAHGKIDNSQQAFLELLGTRWKPQALWYLSLTYTYQENFPKAFETLEEIERGGFKYEEAQELLSQKED